MNQIVSLEPAAQQLKRVITGISENQLTAPTPCDDYTVADILDHILGLARAFTDAARKDGLSSTTEQPPVPNGSNLDPAWQTSIPEQLDRLSEAWADASAWSGETQAGGIAMPSEVAGVVALDEIVMHGWDLARATGQAFTCDGASTQAVLGFAAAMSVPGEEAAREGLFGPVVDVSDQAQDFDRALGLAGRLPTWRA